MKLSICIPHCDEDTDVVVNMLESIKIQQNVDFKEIEVVIVNDGKDFDKLKAINEKDYPFKLKRVSAKHGGVSATRDKAFDESSGEYVMFCDVDDMFYNACGIYIIFKEMEKNQFDVLISSFIEETRDKDKNPVYVPHEVDMTFVHGKVYRRQYLINNNIRWNHNLTIHEDSYFNYLAINLCDKEKYGKFCNTPFYLWRWRDASVCRHDPKYILKTYNNMLESSTCLINELTSRHKDELAQQTVTHMVYDAYFTMNKKEWLDQENQEYRHKTELRFKKYYHDFLDIFNSIPEDAKTQIIIGLKNRMYREGLVMESITFADWIKEIETLTE